MDDLDWYFVHWRYGQRMEDEDLGPDAFRLKEAYDLSLETKFSVHVRKNLALL